MKPILILVMMMSLFCISCSTASINTPETKTISENSCEPRPASRLQNRDPASETDSSDKLSLLMKDYQDVVNEKNLESSRKKLKTKEKRTCENFRNYIQRIGEMDQLQRYLEALTRDQPQSHSELITKIKERLNAFTAESLEDKKNLDEEFKKIGFNQPKRVCFY